PIAQSQPQTGRYVVVRYISCRAGRCRSSEKSRLPAPSWRTARTSGRPGDDPLSGGQGDGARRFCAMARIGAGAAQRLIVARAATDDPVRLGVLISGTGTNLQAIIDAIERRELKAHIKIVISNRPDAYGLERAR